MNRPGHVHSLFFHQLTHGACRHCHLSGIVSGSMAATCPTCLPTAVTGGTRIRGHVPMACWDTSQVTTCLPACLPAHVYVCVCVCVSACVRACACVCACVRACVRVCIRDCPPAVPLTSSFQGCVYCVHRMKRVRLVHFLFFCSTIATSCVRIPSPGCSMSTREVATCMSQTAVNVACQSRQISFVVFYSERKRVQKYPACVGMDSERAKTLKRRSSWRDDKALTQMRCHESRASTYYR